MMQGGEGEMRAVRRRLGMTGEEEIHVTNRLGNGASLMPSPNDCTD